MGAPAATPYSITPVSASSQDEEIMIMVTPKKDYHLTMREANNIISPIQETCQCTSAQTVF